MEAWLIPIVAIVGFFSSIIITAYLFFTTRHKERMALLEYDKTATVFQSMQVQRSGALKYGLVLVLGGLGLLMGSLLETWGMDDEVAFFSMIFVGAGAGLLIYYRLSEKDNASLV